MKEIFLHREDMPMSCSDCDFCVRDEQTCIDRCIVSDSYVDEAQYLHGRLDNCPLRCLEEKYRKMPKYRVGDTVYSYELHPIPCTFSGKITHLIASARGVDDVGFTYLIDNGDERGYPENAVYETEEIAEQKLQKFLAACGAKPQ